MDALILVDIQNDFLPGGALAVHRGDEVIPVAQRLIPKFNMVVATQDWHPTNHGSFAVNHPGRKIGESIDLNGLPQILWPAHCVQGSHGAEFAVGLDIKKARVFQKGTDPQIDSYSGFFDNGHRKATGLGNFLKEQHVTRVIVMGLATDYCVKFTALDARAQGLETTVITEGCRAVALRPTDEADAYEAMRKSGVNIVSSEQQ